MVFSYLSSGIFTTSQKKTLFSLFEKRRVFTEKQGLKEALEAGSKEVLEVATPEELLKIQQLFAKILQRYQASLSEVTETPAARIRLRRRDVESGEDWESLVDRISLEEQNRQLGGLGNQIFLLKKATPKGIAEFIYKKTAEDRRVWAESPREIAGTIVEAIRFINDSNMDAFARNYLRGEERKAIKIFDVEEEAQKKGLEF